MYIRNSCILYGYKHMFCAFYLWCLHVLRAHTHWSAVMRNIVFGATAKHEDKYAAHITDRTNPTVSEPAAWWHIPVDHVVLCSRSAIAVWTIHAAGLSRGLPCRLPPAWNAGPT